MVSILTWTRTCRRSHDGCDVEGVQLVRRHSLDSMRDTTFAFVEIERRGSVLVGHLCASYLAHVGHVGSQIFGTVEEPVGPFHLNGFADFGRTQVDTISALMALTQVSQSLYICIINLCFRMTSESYRAWRRRKGIFTLWTWTMWNYANPSSPLCPQGRYRWRRSHHQTWPRRTSGRWSAWPWSCSSAGSCAWRWPSGPARWTLEIPAASKKRRKAKKKRWANKWDN